MEAAFPKEYARALEKHPNLRDCRMGTCGVKYRPFKDGPAAVLEILVDNKWVALVSELLPEHIIDRFQMAQSEWYQVCQQTSAQEVKLRIMQNATNPSTFLCKDVPLACVGKFPLKEFYEQGHEAITQVEWVKYFMEVAEMADKKEAPGLAMLSKSCENFLKKHEQLKPARKEYLPADLSTGSASSVA